jgi:tetratricopeptide (TPR) repeat protein
MMVYPYRFKRVNRAKQGGLHLLLAGFLALGATVGHADATIPWKGLEDPRVRAAQFDALMGRPLAAMTQLLADEKQGLIKRAPRQVDLALAGMYLGYGAHLAAAEKLKTLANQGQPAEIQDQAWYRLAQLRYRHGWDDEVLNSLSRIRGPLPAASREGRLMMESAILMRQENYDGALSRLEALKAPSLRRALDDNANWESYGRFNLGVVLHKLGREQEAAELLQAVSELDGEDAETTYLKDKAILTLAYDALAKKDVERAKQYFLRARLKGPFAGKALLGLGRSYALQEQHKQSLTPWLELAKRDPADPAVQDVLLAVPFAFGKLDAYKQALEHYENALSIYKQEMVRLQAAEREVKKGIFVDNLVHAMSRYSLPSIEQATIPELPKTNAARYLWPLFSSDEFQETLRNYAQLHLSLGRLEQWDADVKGGGLAASYRQKLEQRIGGLRDEVMTLEGHMREYLQSLALAELQRRKKRIISFAGEARFSMAQIYDYAAKRWGNNP